VGSLRPLGSIDSEAIETEVDAAMREEHATEFDLS
jgi:hypothetical protein